MTALWAQVWPNLLADALTLIPAAALAAWRLDRRAHARHQHLSAVMRDAIRQAIDGPEEQP